MILFGFLSGLFYFLFFYLEKFRKLYLYLKICDQWKEMMNIAGDWEDKEFAARFKPLVNFLSVRSENPLLVKKFKLDLMKEYVTEMGVPNLGKYL